MQFSQANTLLNLRVLTSDGCSPRMGVVVFLLYFDQTECCVLACNIVLAHNTFLRIP